MGRCGGAEDLLVSRVRFTEGDVFADGFAEEKGLLRNKADVAAEHFKRPVVDAAAVN